MMRDTLSLLSLSRKWKNTHRYCRKIYFSVVNLLELEQLSVYDDEKLPRTFTEQEDQETWFFALPLNHSAISSAVTETPLSGIQESSLLPDRVNHRGLVVTLRLPLAGNSEVLKSHKGFIHLLELAHSCSPGFEDPTFSQMYRKLLICYHIRARNRFRRAAC